MLRGVGLRPGWRVLDAGSGSGSFLPLIAEAVGPAGTIVGRRVTEWGLATPIEARVGSVLALPYADDPFDAVWCAATTQYLTDDDLTAALAEFRRVVRPGGLVALKDYDATVPRFLPAPANCLIHYYEVVARDGVTQYQGVLRTPALGCWLRRAGLADVRARTTLVERVAPLAPPGRQLWDDLLAYFAPVALRHALPAEERALWGRLADPAGRARLFDDPDFSCCEGHVVAVGTA